MKLKKRPKRPSLVQVAQKFAEVGNQIACQTYKIFDSLTCHQIYGSPEQAGVLHSSTCIQSILVNTTLK